MKKIISSACLFACFLVFSSTASARDPYADRSLKYSGMIQVKTPDPSKDQITLTNLKTGKTEALKSGKLATVLAGNYRLKVIMQGEIYDGNVTVRPTERTDVVVGFGKLKVVGPRSAIVQVFDKKRGKLIAEFPASKTQLLPRGLYDLKVHVNGVASEKSDVLVIGSKTSVVKVST